MTGPGRRVRRGGLRAFAALLVGAASAAAGCTQAAAQAESGDGSRFVVVNAVSLPDVGIGASLVASGGAEAVLFADSSESLGADAAAVVSRFAPSSVVLVGGVAALGEEVAVELEGLVEGVETERLAGADRVHTASLAAARVGGADADATSGTVVLANGWSLPDVGVAASLVASGGADVVLYSHRSGLGTPTAQALRAARPSRVVIVGGTAALSARIDDELRDVVPGASIRRLGGATRVETAALSARQALTGDAEMLVVADGWSDAEVGVAAALAAAHGRAAVAYAGDGDNASLVGLLVGHSPSRVLLVGPERDLGVGLLRRLQAVSPSSVFERVAAMRPQTAAEQAAVAARHGFAARAAPPPDSVNADPKTAGEFFDSACTIQQEPPSRGGHQWMRCSGDARSVDFAGVDFRAEARARGALGRHGDGQVFLSAGDWRNASFVGADLSGVFITQGDFSWADFSDARLAGAWIGGLRGFGFVPDGAVLFMGARFYGADLAQSFVAAEGQPGRAVRGSLDGGCFADADFTGASLRGHDLREGRFPGALFADADLAGTRLTVPLLSTETGRILPDSGLTAVTRPGTPVAAGAARWADIEWPGIDWERTQAWASEEAGFEGLRFDAPVPEPLRTGRWCEALAGHWPLPGASRAEEFFAANCEVAVFAEPESSGNEPWPYLRCGGWGLDLAGTDFAGVDFGAEARSRGGVGPDGGGLLAFVGHTGYRKADFSRASLRRVYFQGVNARSLSNYWQDARTLEPGVFPDDFTEASFNQARFRPYAPIFGIFNNAGFVRADLRGVSLGGGNGFYLDQSCFESANFHSADLRDAHLPGRLDHNARLEYAWLEGLSQDTAIVDRWLDDDQVDPGLKSAFRRWCPHADA